MLVKKIFLTILFTLVLSGGAFAEIVKEWGVGTASYSRGEKALKVPDVMETSKISLQDAKKKSFERCSKEYSDCIIFSIRRNYGFFGRTETDIVWDEEYKKYSKKLKKDQLVIEEQKQEEIMFTIKDKREQCEAIGFKPETEKFADCVLRLVELDVKQQTQNQIATAQNNGNDALAKQLKRQNNLQSSQALIDLGQQLMNPKRYNSNIYMPQTQRCTMQGFGTFATMRCR